ncbi:MAG: hypothetical protein QM504_02385 [Pseudomonadota bacterium]
MKYLYIYILSTIIYGVVTSVHAASPANNHKVMYFPAGVHRLAEIVSDADFLAIKGDGSGITILEIPGGITLTGKEPRLSGFTLRGYKNRKTGITLKNNYRVIVQDVEIQGYELGLLSLCEYGNRQWLHTYRDLYVYEGPDGSMRSYDTRIRGVELRYIGEKSKKGSWLPDGGFSNTHTFFGGRIAVPGTPLLIAGPTATKLFGTYIDMSDAPIRVASNSAGIQMFGVHLDRNKRARKKSMPVMVLENPKFNRVKMFGDYDGLLRHGLIVDGKNRPISSRYINIGPK